jgi:hypothetical protein
VLAWQFVEHVLDDPLDVVLFAPEVVVQRLQRCVDDLQLGGREIEPEGDLARSDQVVGGADGLVLGGLGP